MRFSAVRSIAVAAIALAFPFAVSAQGTTDGPLAVSNPAFAASIQRIAAASASWRDAIEALQSTGRRAFLVTPDQVKGPLDTTILAQVHPVADEQSRVDTVVVVINLDLLQKLSGLSRIAIDFEDDLDRILAHEIYGHAIPFLLAGNLAGKCADPAIGQSAIASCAVQRENVIRREMGLGQRFEYGRESLALAHRQRW